jgi:hypothetical protein
MLVEYIVLSSLHSRRINTEIPDAEDSLNLVHPSSLICDSINEKGFLEGFARKRNVCYWVCSGVVFMK